MVVPNDQNHFAIENYVETSQKKIVLVDACSTSHMELKLLKI